MSVAFANAVVAGLRYNGVHVKFEPGWQRRGNGQTSAYAGCITHHTGSSYGGGYSILVRGRSDLPGPLCNMCTWPDGSVTLIAAHPGNHAGAAGGSWARPFPDTRTFNRMVWGNEVMYPGFQPWTAAQYRTARIMAGVVCGILRRPNPEWARGHYETSLTGKWDPGIGNGRSEWFPMDRFRREIAAALTSPAPPEEDDLTPEEHRMLETIHRESTTRLPSRVPGSKYADTVLGYSANADAYGYAAGSKLDHVTKRIDETANAILALHEARDAEHAAINERLAAIEERLPADLGQDDPGVT